MTSSSPEGFAGRLLVATPALTDPTFARSVVLLLDHDENGALGVVVNRPTSVDVDAVLPSWRDYTTGPGVLFQGGPVALDSALGLAVVAGRSAGATGSGVTPADEGDEGEEDEPLGWRRVIGRLGLVDLDTPPQLLAAGLSALRIFAGYAGWGGGQLEGELDEGAWYLVDAEPDDAFTDDPAQLWRAVLRRQRGWLSLVSTYPDDPTLN